MEISNQPTARERLIIFHGNAILTFHCWRKNYISEKVSHFIHTFLPCVSVAQAFSQRPRMATTPQKFHSIFFLIYYLELFLNEYWPRKWNVLEMIFRKFIHCLITNYIRCSSYSLNTHLFCSQIHEFRKLSWTLSSIISAKLSQFKFLIIHKSYRDY